MATESHAELLAALQAAYAHITQPKKSTRDEVIYSSRNYNALTAHMRTAIAGATKSNVYRMPPGECAYCDQCRTDSMMPSHTASSHCESGKRNHCTCDACF